MIPTSVTYDGSPSTHSSPPPQTNSKDNYAVGSLAPCAALEYQQRDNETNCKERGIFKKMPSPREK